MLAERAQTQMGVVAAVSLITPAADDKGRVDKATLDQLVPPAPEDNIFAFLDQVLSGSTEQALVKYNELLAANLEPGYIAAMISWQIANIAGASIAGASGPRALKMNPYVFDKSRRVSSRLNRNQIKQVVDLTGQYELTIKTTSANIPQLTRQLLFKLAEV